MLHSDGFGSASRGSREPKASRELAAAVPQFDHADGGAECGLVLLLHLLGGIFVDRGLSRSNFSAAVQPHLLPGNGKDAVYCPVNPTFVLWLRWRWD